MDRETLEFVIFVGLVAIAGIVIGLAAMGDLSGGAKMVTHAAPPGAQPVVIWVKGRLGL